MALSQAETFEYLRTRVERLEEALRKIRDARMGQRRDEGGRLQLVADSYDSFINYLQDTAVEALVED
jgi:hypothetical protein